MQEHSHGAGVPLQIRSERPRSTNPKDFGEISIRDEQWRYLNVDRLRGLDKSLNSFTGKLAEFRTIATADSSRGIVGTPEDLVAANVWQFVNDVQTIEIDDSGEIKVVEINANSTADALQLFVKANKFAKGTLVLNHVGNGNLAQIVEVQVEDEADFTLVSVQDLSDTSVFTSSHFVKVGRNAKFKHIVVSIGGQTIRVVPSISFSAGGGEVELLGAYFANGDQHIEHRPFVDHNQPNCKSNVTYKGALQGAKAHTVWVGDVLIRKEAEGTKTYELNRNLLLTDGARADSVPNLEIETGQIEGAGHASASGRFDDEQLFYLQARGISEQEAKRLVVKGFLNDVISKIGVPQLEDALNAQIELKLERVTK